MSVRARVTRLAGAAVLGFGPIERGFGSGTDDSGYDADVDPDNDSAGFTPAECSGGS